MSDPSAKILDTGETLKIETLKGQAITEARLDIGEPILPDTEIVVIRFPAGQVGSERAPPHRGDIH